MAKTAKRKRKPASAIAKGGSCSRLVAPRGDVFRRGVGARRFVRGIAAPLCKGAILARHQGLYTLYVVNAASIAAAGGPIDVREFAAEQCFHVGRSRHGLHDANYSNAGVALAK